MINHIHLYLFSRRVIFIIYLRAVFLVAGMADVKYALITVEERRAALHAEVALSFSMVLTLLQRVLVVACV